MSGPDNYDAESVNTVNDREITEWDQDHDQGNKTTAYEDPKHFEQYFEPDASQAADEPTVDDSDLSWDIMSKALKIKSVISIPL